jgi:DNA modification methylase
LRDYNNKEIIWNAKEGCQHQWVEYVQHPKGGKGSHKNAIRRGANVGANQNDFANMRDHDIISNTCKLCGAWKGQLGLEPHPQMFIDHLVEIFHEVKRILKPDGTLWLNIGDTFFGGKGKSGSPSSERTEQRDNNGETLQKSYQDYSKDKPQNLCKQDGGWLQSKQLLLIPVRVAMALQSDGWILRNTIIWQKPNAMPSSVKDRFTVDFEYVFFFVKSKKYFFNPQYDPYTKPLERWGGDKLKADGESKWDNGTGQSTYRDRDMRPNPNGRNKRCVWSIVTKPYKGAHFATFPEALVEPCIKAGCPEFICKQCGEPRRPIFKQIGREQQQWAPATDKKSDIAQGEHGENSLFKTGYKFVYETVGLTDCGCNAGWNGGIVLDPFNGSGTTCSVAKRLNMNYIGIESNPEYCLLAKERIGDTEIINYVVNENKIDIDEYSPPVGIYWETDEHEQPLPEPEIKPIEVKLSNPDVCPKCGSKVYKGKHGTYCTKTSCDWRSA